MSFFLHHDLPPLDSTDTASNYQRHQLYIIIIIIDTYNHHAHAAVGFISHPVSAFSPAGRNITFSCQLDEVSNGVSWIVNTVLSSGEAVHLDTAASSHADLLQSRKIFFQSSGNRFTLTVFASKQNNQTSVTCKQLHIPNSIFSQTATLTVLGMLQFNCYRVS